MNNYLRLKEYEAIVESGDLAAIELLKITLGYKQAQAMIYRLPSLITNEELLLLAKVKDMLNHVKGDSK